MIAALQPLRAQEIRDLIGTARQRLERELCFPVVAGIDDPQRRTILALWIARQFRIEPVQRPVERHWVRPLKSLDRRIVVDAMLEQESSRFLESGHISPCLITSAVIAGLDPAIHQSSIESVRWMRGSSPRMTMIFLKRLTSPPAHGHAG